MAITKKFAKWAVMQFACTRGQFVVRQLHAVGVMALMGVGLIVPTGN
jgi:hypothetical protein